MEETSFNLSAGALAAIVEGVIIFTLLIVMWCLNRRKGGRNKPPSRGWY